MMMQTDSGERFDYGDMKEFMKDSPYMPKKPGRKRGGKTCVLKESNSKRVAAKPPELTLYYAAVRLICGERAIVWGHFLDERNASWGISRKCGLGRSGYWHTGYIVPPTANPLENKGLIVERFLTTLVDCLDGRAREELGLRLLVVAFIGVLCEAANISTEKHNINLDPV